MSKKQIQLIDALQNKVEKAAEARIKSDLAEKFGKACSFSKINFSGVRMADILTGIDIEKVLNMPLNQFMEFLENYFYNSCIEKYRKEETDKLFKRLYDYEDHREEFEQWRKDGNGFPILSDGVEY